MIHQAARRGDDGVHAVPQCSQLAVVRLAAVDWHQPHAPVATKLAQGFRNLYRQFASGRQHHRLWDIVRHVNALHERDAKRCGLASSGQRLRDHVPPLQQKRDRPGLDRGRLLEAQLI